MENSVIGLRFFFGSVFGTLFFMATAYAMVAWKRPSWVGIVPNEDQQWYVKLVFAGSLVSFLLCGSECLCSLLQMLD